MKLQEKNVNGKFRIRSVDDKQIDLNFTKGKTKNKKGNFQARSSHFQVVASKTGELNGFPGQTSVR